MQVKLCQCVIEVTSTFIVVARLIETILILIFSILTHFDPEGKEIRQRERERKRESIVLITINSIYSTCLK